MTTRQAIELQKELSPVTLLDYDPLLKSIPEKDWHSIIKPIMEDTFTATELNLLAMYKRSKEQKTLLMDAIKELLFHRNEGDFEYALDNLASVAHEIRKQDGEI